jgi:regulatory protein
VSSPEEAAYLAGLKLVAGRELTSAQVETRLAKRGHDAASIEHALDRLRRANAIDDERAALAMARREASTKGRGPLRVKAALNAAGVRRETVSRALDAVDDPSAVDSRLRAALERRLRGRATIASRTDLQRLYRYLVGQGFEPDRVMAALRERQAHSLDDD